MYANFKAARPRGEYAPESRGSAVRIRRNAHCRICVLKALKSDYLSVCRKTMSSLSDTRRARIRSRRSALLFSRAPFHGRFSFPVSSGCAAGGYL